MQQSKSIRAIANDVRRVSAYRDVWHTPEDVDCRVSANVGELMAAALAAAGSYAIVIGGRTACKTDYLAAQGATFPNDIPYAELVAFNSRTLREDMDEEAEHARYAMIAEFFGRNKEAL